ncbi:MAG: DUF1269 domain-containing protein [bacterium]
MNKMLVAFFDTEQGAYEGLRALKDLHNEGDITLYATAVITMDSSGAVDVKQKADERPVGIAVGMLTGGLAGLLAGPVGGVVGASAGSLAGLIFDLHRSGVDTDLLDDVSGFLLPGKAAVVAEVQETWKTPVDMRLGELGGRIFRRPRSEVVEDQLVRESAALSAEMEQIKGELRHASAETKAKLQKELEGVKTKMEAAETRAKTRAEHVQNELDAKVTALQDQMKQAGDRQKAKIQKHIEEVKADYAVRSAKLEKARKLIKEAL